MRWHKKDRNHLDGLFVQNVQNVELPFVETVVAHVVKKTHAHTVTHRLNKSRRYRTQACAHTSAQWDTPRRAQRMCLNSEAHNVLTSTFLNAAPLLLVLQDIQPSMSPPSRCRGTHTHAHVHGNAHAPLLCPSRDGAFAYLESISW